MSLSPTPRPQRMSRAGVIVGLYGGLGALAVLWGAVRGHPNVYLNPSLPLSPARLALSPIVGVALGLTVVFLSRFATHRLEWARVLHREFHAVVHELNSKEIFL